MVLPSIRIASRLLVLALTLSGLTALGIIEMLRAASAGAALEAPALLAQLSVFVAVMATVWFVALRPLLDVPVSTEEFASAAPPGVTPRDDRTGLCDQYAARGVVDALVASRQLAAVALCDVDGFAGYREINGLRDAERALDLYAEVLGHSLRPGDLVCHTTFDRFLCVFPGSTSDHAVAAMERVRERLAVELMAASLAPFTTSIGVADSGEARSGETRSGEVRSGEVRSGEELVERADIALVVAKGRGGNRVQLDRYDASST